MAKKATKFKFEAYDKKHLNSLFNRIKGIAALFDEAAKEGARAGAASGFNDPERPFYLSNFPAVQKRIDEVVKALHDNIVSTIEEGDREEWLLSCEKNDKFIEAMTLSTGIPIAQISQWKQPNLDALEAFQARKIEGMGLSAKVWNITDQFKQELELALDIGLGEGKSAAALSRDVRKYLNEPERLFRRVRDKHGVLRLSKAAKAYHPGQGVYRSSARNAMRLTATENNIAYRTADFDRWQTIPFVIGIEIKLSNNHPVYDICDELAGIYPKDFKYTGWHPFCRCFAVPVMAKMEEFLEYQRKLIDGEDVEGFEFSGKVEKVPDNFTTWLERNRERVKSTTTVPYFIKDNGKYVPKDWVNGIGSLAKKSDKGLLNDVKEAMFKLKDPTFVTEKEVRTMITDFAKAEPSLFYGGLSKVKISRSDSAFMSNGRQVVKADGSYYLPGGNTITIHNHDFNMGGGVVFNPLHELKGAMKAIASGTPLTFQQEYAVESLWHEIRHAGAVGWKDYRKRTENLTSAMEVINQFCARRSYGKLLRSMGGSVAHKKAIIADGYGYGRSVRHFEELLTRLNVSGSEAYAHFSPMIIAEPYEEIFDRVVQFIVSKGVEKSKAEALVKALRQTDSLFSALLTGV